MNIQQIEKHLTTMLARINLIGPKMGNAQSKALITNLRTDIQLIHHAAKELDTGEASFCGAAL